MNGVGAGEGIDVAAETFGRDSAMFESLLRFMAQLSLALWAVVVVTLVIRFVAVRLYRRDVPRSAVRRSPAAVRREPNVVAQLDVGLAGLGLVAVGPADPASGDGEPAAVLVPRPAAPPLAEQTAVPVGGPAPNPAEV